MVRALLICCLMRDAGYPRARKMLVRVDNCDRRMCESEMLSL